MSESQSTLLRNTSGWLLPMRSIMRKKNEVTSNGTLIEKLLLMAQKKGDHDFK